MKRLDGFAHKCFKKIKVQERVDKVLEDLYTQKTQLVNKDDKESKEKLQKVEKELVDKYSEEMYHKIKKELKGLNSEEGGWNPGHLWKLKQKLSPRPIDPPTAIINEEGILLTDPNEIAKEAIKHYQKLFENMPINDEIK